MNPDMSTALTADRPRSPITALVRRHPLAVFVALACLFGWSIFIAAGLGADTGGVDNMPLGPIIAAAIVASLLGRTALRGWVRRLRRWDAPAHWYAIAVLAPVAINATIVLVNHAFGAPLPTGAQLASWPDVAANFVIMLVMVGIGEEAGWSAFAAPLLAHRSFFARWVVLSAIRIGWHLPLMVSGLLPWDIGIVGNAAWQMIVLCILDRTDGRWSLAAVWHTMLSVTGGQFVFQMVHGADRDRLGLLLCLGYVAAAAVMFLATRPALGSGDGRPHSRPGHGAGQGGSGAVLVPR
jgi:hypothetical protein